MDAVSPRAERRFAKVEQYYLTLVLLCQYDFVVLRSKGIAVL